MSRKRPAYVQELIRNANTTLRHLKVKSEIDSLFCFITTYLSVHHMYEGFNYYNLGKDANGNPHPVLAGSATDYEFLQIY